MRVRPLLSFLLAAWVAGVTPATADESATALDRFQLFDMDGDGTTEIRSLTRLLAVGHQGPLVVVFVEPRLLEPLEGAEPLRPRLDRLLGDLADEGCRTWLVAADLEPGANHRDGRLVLALREVLRALREERDFVGALLVGHFPDALLVRTCSWRKRGKVVLRKGTPEEHVFEDVRYLRRVPELVAHRADIVLSDLDGRWEDVYVEPKTTLATTMAVFPDGVPAGGGEAVDAEQGEVTFEDFFHVSDGALSVRPADDGDSSPRIVLDDGDADHEVGEADRGSPNRIARPDIVVSRIDARGIALRPRGDVRGADGTPLLDDTGRPQVVSFGEDAHVPHWRDELWEADPVLERQLLAEFLERNHAYRTGASEVAWRPSSLAHGLPSGYAAMAKAADDWVDVDRALDDIQGNATLEDVAGWLTRPAVLRTLRAHSDAWGSVFHKGRLAGLARYVGDAPWGWSPDKASLVPSLDAACRGGKLDWFLLQALWRAGATSTLPAFYVHTGCEGISPPGSRKHSWTHPAYGLRQGAEALLFFGSGLALVGRAKVFYDEPRGFASALKRGASFGEAWARYFVLESEAESWSKVGGDIGRKRSYFWSVLGDWTLRLRRPTR
ncbi:MAG: hypothetical protein R3F05_15645 [Planctomycetota bacterium]|nr:hypothetical protein [Planctomycetota bacterium]MCB9901526.1 hypothetical protein [Planctomycetota bacterium]